MGSVKGKPPSRLQRERIPIRRRPPEERAKDYGEVVIGYTEEEAIEEASRCLSCKSKPCTKACPIQQKAMEYVTLIKQGKFEEAYSVIREENPLPGVLGRVCYHPCEEWIKEKRLGCVVGIKGEPIAIMYLKRFVCDYVDNSVEERVTAEPKDERVAIIGSGPAGLMAAHELALMGYQVTIFEKYDVLGGMLTTAIPEYRLPRDIIKKDIDNILSLGIEVEKNHEIESLDEIRGDFDAVLVATGTPGEKMLGIEGEHLKGVYHALDFLLEVNSGQQVDVGKNVAIIGGGDVAMDAARTVLRLGGKATVVYRRTEKQMPVDPTQLEEAKEEGVEFRFLKSPWRFVGEDRVTAMDYQKMRLGDPDASGRRSPVAIDGETGTVDIDSVLLAIGEKPDLGFLPDDIQATKWGTLDVGESYMTNYQGVFAAGDVVTGPNTIVEAMASARGAAKAINEYLLNGKAS